MKGGNELNMLWWRTCTDVLLLKSKKGKREESEIVVKERSLRQATVPIAQHYFAG